jgi:hypothetical protein
VLYVQAANTCLQLINLPRKATLVYHINAEFGQYGYHAARPAAAGAANDNWRPLPSVLRRSHG